MRTSSDPYWFPAKHYGWGWGLPNRWQGWVVLLVYVVVIGSLAWLAPPHASPRLFFGLAALATLLLVLVCRLKGEPLRWRWGRK